MTVRRVDNRAPLHYPTEAVAGNRTGQELGGGEEDAAAEDAGAVDPRIAELARELATAINTAEASGQVGMRDLALEVIKDSVEAQRAARAAAAAPAPGSPRALNPFALGLPLLPVGAFLFFIFPPVGLLLFVAGLGASGFGLIVAAGARIRSGGTSEKAGQGETVED